MKKVIVLAGSNSKQSINKQLAIYTSSLLKNVEISILDLNDYDLPIYSVDIEKEEGIPSEATKFYNDLSAGEAYVISLAEHNGSYSAAFKNAYDWATRVEKKVWGEKPVLLLSTSPGTRGGATVLEAAKTSFPYIGAKIVGNLAFPSFYEYFKDGQIVNDQLNSDLMSQVLKLQNALE